MPSSRASPSSLRRAPGARCPSTMACRITSAATSLELRTNGSRSWRTFATPSENTVCNLGSREQLAGRPAVGDYRWRVESEAIAREQRRRLAREALEFEVGREAALGEQLQETIAEDEGPAIDERVFARMAPEDVELVRAALGDDSADEFDAEGDEWFVEEEDEAKIVAEDRESEISRLEGEIRDSRRRQAALRRYLEALEADSRFEA